MTCRTEWMERQYKQAKKDGTLVPLNEEKAVKNFVHWKIVENRFPHDKLNTKHHMIVLKKNRSSLWLITKAERDELWMIFEWVDKEYDYIKINMQSMRSINNIPHVHLCDHREEYK